MAQPFNKDSFPGKPKILFIGLAQSTHTHAWIDLLSDFDFNVRLFAMPKGFPPDDWPVKTYINVPYKEKDNEFRKYMYSGIKGRFDYYYNKIARRIGLKPIASPDMWLANIITKWRPDIIQTLGLFDDQGGLFYLQTRKKFKLEKYGHFVIQLRGGCDIALRRHNPDYRAIIKQALTECEQIVTDNQVNIKYAGDLGIPFQKFASIVPVPGSGGIELSDFSPMITMPSKRERIILWPKAYECQWSKALPVLDAIQKAWKKIKPCEIYLLAITSDVYEWCLSMPEEIRQHLHMFKRIPRREVFSLMKKARIMLAPSLIDGFPNSLQEAMAFGALPIVSPLETITPVVKQDENVLFARNLYSDEIAAALVCSMTDDDLVDRVAQNNLSLIEKIANRQTIKIKVSNFYTKLIGGGL